MRLPTACAAAALALLVPAASRPGSTAGPADGLVLAVGGGHLKVAFCADDVVRVAFARDPAFFDRPSLAAGVRRCGPVLPKRTDAAGQATLSTAKMRVRVDLGTGEIAFLDARGEEVLVEKKGGRTLVPAEVQGENDVPRPPGMGRERRRVALRPRPAPARPDGHQGVRPRPLAAQRDGDRALPRLQPGLRHPVGQHVLHALRRPARVGADPVRPAPRRDGEAGRADRLVPRRRGLREARRHARGRDRST